VDCPIVNISLKRSESDGELDRDDSEKRSYYFNALSSLAGRLIPEITRTSPLESITIVIGLSDLSTPYVGDKVIRSRFTDSELLSHAVLLT
jgi:hypothetical protein